MIQFFVGGTDSLAVNNRYNSLQGYSGNVADFGGLVGMYVVFPVAGVLSDFSVWLNAAPGAGAGRTFELKKNLADTGYSVTLGPSDTYATNPGTLEVGAGDTIVIHNTATGSPPPDGYLFAIKFTSGADALDHSVILGNCAQSGLSATVTNYLPLSGSSGPNATEATAQQLIPAPGILKKFYVMITDPGTDPDGYRFTVRKNGASTGITVTITAENTSAIDVVNEVRVAAGDLIDIMVEPLNAPANSIVAAWGISFVPDEVGVSVFMCGSNDALNNVEAEYNQLAGSDTLQWGAVSRNMRFMACTVRNLYVQLSSSPYVDSIPDDKYQFGIDKNDVATALSATVSDLGTGNNKAHDVVHSVSAAHGDLFGIRSTPNSLPATPNAKWGVVIYIPFDLPDTPTFEESRERLEGRGYITLYIDELTEAMEIFEIINEAVGSYLYSGYDGKYRYKVFEIEPGESVMQFSDDEIFSFEENVDASEVFSNVRAEYAYRELQDFPQVYLYEKKAGQYLQGSPIPVSMEKRLPFSQRPDAIFWAQRALQMYGERRILHKARVSAKGWTLLPGKFVQITYSRRSINAVLEALEVERDLNRLTVDLLLGDQHGMMGGGGGGVPGGGTTVDPGFWTEDAPVLPTRFSELAGYGTGDAENWNKDWDAEIKAWARQNMGFWCDENGYADPTDPDSRLPSTWV